MGHEAPGVVAMDGPSGTGKSTVSRRLAIALGARYLDTGAMYRAVTLAVLRAGIDPTAAAKVTAIAESARLELGTDPAAPTVRLDGDDVAGEIRSPEVTTAVSPVSAVGRVRELLVGQQQAVIADAASAGLGIVVEGRDIGTTVAPGARLKIYLTASAEARARRRTAQDTASGRVSTVDATMAAVQRRDRYDSTRSVSPLRKAEDAVEVDTTELDITGVLARLLELAESCGLPVVTQRAR